MENMSGLNCIVNLVDIKIVEYCSPIRIKLGPGTYQVEDRWARMFLK